MSRPEPGLRAQLPDKQGRKSPVREASGSGELWEDATSAQHSPATPEAETRSSPVKPASEGTSGLPPVQPFDMFAAQARPSPREPAQQQPAGCRTPVHATMTSAAGSAGGRQHSRGAQLVNPAHRLRPACSSAQVVQQAGSQQALAACAQVPPPAPRPRDPPFSVQLADSRGAPVHVAPGNGVTEAPKGEDAVYLIVTWLEGHQQLYDWGAVEQPAQHASAVAEEARRRDGPQSHTLDECIEVGHTLLKSLWRAAAVSPLAATGRRRLRCAGCARMASELAAARQPAFWKSCRIAACHALHHTVSPAVACAQAFLQPEQLGASDSWYCPRCKEHVQAAKKLDLWTLPEVLIVHLKRFSFSVRRRTKLDNPVHFPVRSLDMRRFVMRDQVRLQPLAVLVTRDELLPAGALGLHRCLPAYTRSVARDQANAMQPGSAPVSCHWHQSSASAPPQVPVLWHAHRLGAPSLLASARWWWLEREEANLPYIAAATHPCAARAGGGPSV